MALMFTATLLIDGKERMICNTKEEKFNERLAWAKTKGYQVLKKTKMYPVGRWETYQHVFYNANDRAMNAVYDAKEHGSAEQLDKAIEWNDRVSDLLGKFDCGPRDRSGIVYAEYNDYKVMKDIIGGYAYRHGGVV